MDSKERMLIALDRGKPDRLPVSIHQWQQYHLEEHMNGMSPLEAFRATGLDAQIQYYGATVEVTTPEWQDEQIVVNSDPDMYIVHHTIRTPEGDLTYKTEGNRQTVWITEYLIKHDEDIRLVRKYMPIPGTDLKDISGLYNTIGGCGILRGFVWGNQGGCWQHAAYMVDITDLVMATYDRPEWVHELLGILLEKKLRFIETMKGAKFDVIETGGGAASSTVISPGLFKEFCLPYDKKIHDALHSLGFKASYHTCGGTRGIEDLIVANGCDASETLAPMSVGGNQEPWDYSRKIGGRVALIGGLDQLSVLTDGTVPHIKKKVHELFEKVGPGGGYICAASDHFFETPVKHLKALAEAGRECVY